MGDAVAAVAKDQATHNFSVVGVAVGSNPAAVRSFAESKGFDFPVFDDSSGRITRTLGLRLPLAVLGIDPEGYLAFGMGSFTSGPEAGTRLEAQIRDRLRLPDPNAAASGDLDQRPTAPNFEAVQMEGEPFQLSDYAGKPKVVIFFLHTCPHCHEALKSLRKDLEAMPEESRPLLFGVSVDYKPRPPCGPRCGRRTSTSSPCSSIPTRRPATPTACSPACPTSC